MTTITITVEGGVIQDIKGIPKNTKIKVLDFDIDGLPEEETKIINEKGDRANVSYWYYNK